MPSSASKAQAFWVQLSYFFGVIDRESPTTGVWVLDWVIYNSIINEISSIAREVYQGASSRL